MIKPDKGHCTVCGEEVTITAKDVLRVHGPKAARCGGGGLEPREAAITGPAPAPEPRPQEAPVLEPGSQLARVAASSDQAAGIIARALPLAAAVRAAKTQQDAAQAFIEGSTVSGTDPAFRNNLSRSAPADPGGAPLSDDADVAAFLGEEPHAPEATPGRWFRSSYDGDCDVCGAAMFEGDEIRADGEGGWQGQECCGQAQDDGEEGAADSVNHLPEQPRADRPVIVSTKPPINGNHRYELPHPLTGKKWSATRATNFNKRASDRFALAQWEMRCVLAGMAVDPGIAERVLELLGEDVLASVKTEKVRLNALVDAAKAATKAGDKASTGTELHKWTEMLDAGTVTIDRVPVNHRPIAARYLAVLKASGFTPVPHLIERTTGYAEFGVVGTFDQVMQGPDGKYRVVDKKSGSLQFGQDEMSIQLAVYARGINAHGIAQWSGEGSAKDWRTWEWVPPTDTDGNVIAVEEDWGVIVHMPQDNSGCTLMQVDLRTGWDGAELCRDLGDWHRVKSTMVPMEAPGLDDVPPVDDGMAAVEAAVANLGEPGAAGAEALAVLDAGSTFPGVLADAAAQAGDVTDALSGHQWEALFSGVRTKEEANDLWRRARASRVEATALKHLTALAADALSRIAAEAPVFWEELFTAVTTPAEANQLWARAKASDGMTLLRLGQLTAIARGVLERRSWESRMGAVTTKEEANDVYAQARAKAADLGKEFVMSLIGIGNTALSRG